MNEALHLALEEAIKVKVDAQRALDQYDQGRKPFLSAVKRARERYAKLEQCIYTGEYQPELGFDVQASNGPAPETSPEPHRETTPVNFFGKRQRTAKGALH